MAYKLDYFNSSISLVKVPFNEDDNYILGGKKEDIANFFNTRGGVIINDIQPFKIEKEIKYILKLPNDLTNEFTNIIQNSYFSENVDNLKKLFNYCKFYLFFQYYDELQGTIQTNGGFLFYFIRGIKWKSTQTIELDLKMDVLNTLNYLNASKRDGTGGNQFFTNGPKSNITRTHFNRLTTYLSKTYFKIDELSEGIHAPLYHTNDLALTKYAEHENFYLIYKNSLDNSSATNNVVNCYLTYGKLGTPQNKNVLLSGTARIFTPQMVGNNWFYLVSPYTFSLYDDITQENVNIDIQVNDAYLEISRIGDKLRVVRAKANYESTTKFIYVTSRIEFDTNITYYYTNSMITRPITNVNQITILPYTTLDPTDKLELWKDINQVNRTDSKLIKIIKLPYAPTLDIEYTNNYYTFNDSVWRYDETTNMLKLVDLNKRFISSINYREWRDVKFNELVLSSKSPTALRSINYEPKLYHSDFSYTKLNYDSFSLMIYNEFLNPGTLYDSAIPTIYFYCTTSINSRFLFEAYNIYNNSFTDYPNFLAISRNNELGLYNSSYINYIRNGFNFDVKNKDRSVGVQYGLGALQIVGAVGSAVSSVYTGGFGVAGAISLGTSAVATLTHAINNQISQETQIQQKLEALKAQANEIQSSDDVDLLDIYNGNVLIKKSYRVSTAMQELLYNLFFYTGYKCNIIGNSENYINNRYWFNYIQADLHLTNVSRLIPTDLIEEYKNKFKNGVTIFHPHASVTGATIDKGYNIEQDLENWENELVSEA